MQYVAYVRKSTDDKTKQIQSIPNQLNWVKKTVARLGIPLIKTFIDKKTATKPGREGFNEMMQFIENSPEPLGILCWKVSRLARNSIDEGVFKYAFRQGKIQHVYAADREYKKGDNIILIGLEFGVAEQSSIDLRSSVIFGMNKKIEDGYRPGVAPLGYINDPFTPKGERKIFIDEHRFAPLQNAWKKFLTGAYSVEMIRKELNASGFTTKKGQPIRRNVMHRILTNPFYGGYFLWNGELYKGKHEAMITMAEFNEAQQILKRRGKPNQGKKQNTYSGLIRCGECSYSITTEYHTKRIKKTGELKTYCYLRCSKSSPIISCSQRYIRLQKFEDQVVVYLSQIIIPQVFIDWCFGCIRKREQGTAKELARKKAQIKRQLNETEAMTETLVDNLNNGTISQTIYEKTIRRYSTKKATLEEQLSCFDEKQENWIDRAYNDFSFAQSAQKQFIEGDKNTKRETLMRIGSNWTLKDGKLLVELHPQYILLTEIYNLIRQQSPLVEPSITCSDTGQNMPLTDDCPVWCSLWDRLRTFYQNL